MCPDVPGMLSFAQSVRGRRDPAGAGSHDKSADGGARGASRIMADRHSQSRPRARGYTASGSPHEGRDDRGSPAGVSFDSRR